MHALSFASVLALALAASAFNVTSPNSSSSWSSTGTNTLSWTRVATDAANFSVVLTNTDRTVLPTNNMLLVPFVDATTATSVSIAPPAGGLPVGGSFRVNLIKDQNDVNSIYAQSNEFEIVSGGSASGSSTTSGASTGTGSTITVPTASQTPGGSGSPTQANTGLNPTQTQNSAVNSGAHVGLMGVAVLFIGSFLA